VRERYLAAEVHGETGLDGLDLSSLSRSLAAAHAIDWIATTLENHDGPVTLVLTGPLTNIALFLSRYPELAGRVERIVLMGGAYAEGNVTSVVEFNIWADPEVAHWVFTSGIDVTMVGLDVTYWVLLRPADVDVLRVVGKA